MNYEKKYKEALEIAKRCYKDLNNLDGVVATMSKDFFEEVFPELKESEDEIIRKDIIETIKIEAKEFPSSVIASKAELWLDWLEKQGEKSNIHQDAEDDLRRQHTIRVLEYARSLNAYNQYGKESINKDIAWLEKQGDTYDYTRVDLSKFDDRIQEFSDMLEDKPKSYWDGFYEAMDWVRINGNPFKEKQGKQKSTKNIMNVWKDMRLEVYQQASGNRHEPNYSDDTTKMFSLNDIDEMIEKMSEQEPTDKVEPEFKIEKGKWYVCNNSRYKDFVIGKAYYCPKDGMLKPNENEMARYVARDCFHLWTIQDAKDGDVLYTTCGGKNKMIFIYNGIDIDSVFCYCLYSITGIEYKMFNTVCHIKSDICPATKEQRDTLMKAIDDAGYEWDFEAKEFEVKEVDLEKEIQDHISECLDVKFPTTDIEMIKKDVEYTARKFFELGLKHRKGNKL